MRQMFALFGLTAVLGLAGCTQPKATNPTKVASKAVDTKLEVLPTKPADTKPAETKPAVTPPANTPVKLGDKTPATPPK